jgi:hypothetical protein
LCSSCHLAYHCRSRGNISPGQLFLDLKPTFRRYLSQFNFQLNCSK